MDELDLVRQTIGERIFIIRENMKKHAVCDAPVLLPVTKTYPAWMINLITQFDLFEIGENRVQEILQKKSELLPQIVYHQIGQLQTNKVKSVVAFVGMIQSVDRVSLAQEIEKQAAKIERQIPILLEVNTSLETQKGGVAPDDLGALFAYCQNCPHLQIRGLMTVAPHAQEETVRLHFKKTKAWFDRLKQDASPSFDTLSMGMSGDYLWALEEGATMVRIGSAIFGQRI